MSPEHQEIQPGAPRTGSENGEKASTVKQGANSEKLEKNSGQLERQPINQPIVQGAGSDDPKSFPLRLPRSL